MPLHWTATDGTTIAARRWLPANGARGMLCLVHGLGEYSVFYQPLAKYLTEHGLGLLVADIRGHGESGGPRADATYPQLYSDIDLLLDQGQLVAGTAPLLLAGHSWGGNLVLSYAREGRLPPAVAGLIACSPLVRPATPPPNWKVTVGRLLARISPRTRLATDLPLGELTRDPAVGEAVGRDALFQRQVSARLGLAMLEAAAALEHWNHPPRSQVLITHGDCDSFTDFRASHELARRLRADWKPWPGARHHLLLETNRDEVFAYLARWITTHCG